MLSTKQGFQFLQSTNWLNDKRRQWSSLFHTRHTNMLGTALIHSVSTTTGIAPESDVKDVNDDSN